MQPIPWLDDAEQAAWRSVVAGTHRLVDLLDTELKAEGLSHDDYGVLVALSEAEGERLRMSELADAVVESRSRLTHHIGRMEKRGLVVRTSCPTDRRGSWAELTPIGRDAIERLAPHHVAGVRRWFLDHASPDELAVVAAVFGRVDGAIRQAAANGGRSMCDINADDDTCLDAVADDALTVVDAATVPTVGDGTTGTAPNLG